MAEHNVQVKTPALEVRKVDVIFNIRRDGQLHGRLKVSKGGVEWMQRSDSKKAFHISLDKLDKIFSKYADEGATRSGKRRSGE